MKRGIDVNKQYNVDDILQEIKSKKSRQPGPSTQAQEKILSQERPALRRSAGAEPLQESEEPLATDGHTFHTAHVELPEDLSLSAPLSAKKEPFHLSFPEEGDFSFGQPKVAEKPVAPEPAPKAEPKPFKLNFQEEESSFSFGQPKAAEKPVVSEPAPKAELKPEPKPFKLNFQEEAASAPAPTPAPKAQPEAPKPTAQPKEKKPFKVTLPEDEEELDYSKYFGNLTQEEPGESFRFQDASQPEPDPMGATREVNFGGSLPKTGEKAPFKLNFNFDEDEEDSAPAAQTPPRKSLFPDEMMEEEEPKGRFGRKKRAAKKQEEPLPQEPAPKGDDEDNDLEDYKSPADKEAVIRDMRQIKIGLFVRIALVLLLFGLSTYLALSATNPLLDLPTLIHPETQLRNFMIANTLVAAIGALVCSNIVGGGLIALLKMRADCDTLPSMAVIATLAQGVCFIIKPDLLNMTVTSLSDSDYSITTAVSLFFPVALLILFFDLIGKLMTVLRIQNNFKMVASDRSKFSINMMENRGLLKEWTADLEMEDYLVAYPVKTRFLSKFLEYSYSTDHAETMSAILAPVSILAALLLAGLSYVFNKDMGVAISTFAAVLCLCTPLSATIAASWPMLRLSNALTPNGAMVAGYEPIAKFAATEGVVVKAADLFPAENVALHAIKAFDQSKIDSVILDAASVVCSSEGMLSAIFLKIIGGDRSLLRPVENITYEDGMGQSAWVDGKRVLIGNRELMINHGVDVPSLDYEKRYVKGSKNIVYLSNSGELSAMFVISYNPSESLMPQLDTLADNGMFLIVDTSDPNITREKVHEAYDFPLEQLQIMPAKSNSLYRSMVEEQPQAPARIGILGGAKQMIRAICGCINVKSAITKGVVIQMASLIIGYGIVAVFSLVGELGMLSFTHVIAYQLLWTLLVLLIPNLKKL